MAAWSSGAPVPDSATMTMGRQGRTTGCPSKTSWAAAVQSCRSSPSMATTSTGRASPLRMALYSLGAAIRLQPPPLSAVARHEFVGGVRAPRARLVVGEPPRLGVSPTLDDWGDERPGRLHLIIEGW